MSKKDSTLLKSLSSKYALTEMKVDPASLVIVTDKTHPLFQERALWPVREELVTAIKEKGFNSVVLIGEELSGDEGEKQELVVIAGRGRTKAAVAAGLTEVPAYNIGDISKLSSSELQALMIQENEIRRDNNPLEKAKEALRLLNARLEEGKPADWPEGVPFKPSSAERADAVKFVAETFGLSTSRMNNMLGLMNEDKISAGLTKAMEKGEVSLNAALLFTKLNPIEQEQVIGKLKPVIEKKAKEHEESKGKKGKAVSRSEADAVINKDVKIKLDRSWLEKIKLRRGTPPDVKDFIKELLNPGSTALPYLPGTLEKLSTTRVDETGAE